MGSDKSPTNLRQNVLTGEKRLFLSWHGVSRKRKYSVLGFCLKKIAKSMTPTSRFLWQLWQLWQKNRPRRAGPTPHKQEPASGWSSLVHGFSYWSNRILSIDFISSIYKFFSSSLIKLFFFFKSFFFFKVSFVFVFSKIDWKRSNVSSSIIYNWL